jgi:hypothetical protein
MAAGAGSEESRKPRGITIGVPAACLLAAVFVWVLWWRGQDGQLDTPASAARYVCPADGAVLEVTPARFEKMLKSGQAGPTEGPAGRSDGLAGRRGGLYVRCPKCGKRIMIMGTRCPKDGTVFAGTGADGKPAGCPKCGWKAGK